MDNATNATRLATLAKKVNTSSIRSRHLGADAAMRNVGRAAIQNAKSIPHRPSVYVYTLPRSLSGTWLYQNLTGNDHDFHFAGEFVFWQRLLHDYPQASPDVSASGCHEASPHNVGHFQLSRVHLFICRRQLTSFSSLS